MPVGCLRCPQTQLHFYARKSSSLLMGTSVGDCSKQAYPFYIIEGWQIAVKFNVPNSVLFWSCNSGRSYPNEHHALPTMCCVTVRA